VRYSANSSQTGRRDSSLWGAGDRGCQVSSMPFRFQSGTYRFGNCGKTECAMVHVHERIR